jgi:flagellar motor switch protein FliN
MDNNNTQENEMEMEQPTDEERARELEKAALADFEELPKPGVSLAETGVPVPTGERPLAALYELMLPITIELGRTRMSVQEVLQLSRGSVVELDRLAGEPVDIFVGDRRFAEGEVVVLGENFGVRITRIIPSAGSAEAA